MGEQISVIKSVVCYRHKCAICGNDFQSQTDRAKYCSSLCRTKASKKTKQINKSTAEVFRKQDKCSYCGEDMKAKYRNKKFCSDKCRVYSKRAEKIIKPEVKAEEKVIQKEELSKKDLFKLILKGEI